MKALHKYILKRLVGSFVTISIIIFVVFTISRMAGDPIEAYVTPETPPEIVELIRRKYHLDKPIPIQFIYWLQGVAEGDLGRAFSRGEQPVTEMVARYLPYSLELNIYTLILTLPLSFWIGTKAAVKKDSLFDHLTRLFAILGRCLPGFFTGLLILAYLYPTGWIVVDPRFTFPRVTGMPTIDALLDRDWAGLLEAIKYLSGPLITSFIGGFASNTRILRSNILEELSKDYINTGKAKGLSNDYVEKKYARRNAMIPFLTLLGMRIAGMLGGSAILEAVFNRVGVGSISAAAASAGDHNTIQAFTMIYATMLVLANLVIDITYGFVDPRIRYGEET